MRVKHVHSFISGDPATSCIALLPNEEPTLEEVAALSSVVASDPALLTDVSASTLRADANGLEREAALLRLTNEAFDSFVADRYVRAAAALRFVAHESEF